MRARAIIFWLAFGVQSAFAQSAEETVAFLVQGAEDGGRNGGVSWSKLDDDPLTLKGDYISGENLPRSMTLIVKRIETCKFEAQITTPVGTSVTHIDFSTAYDIEKDDNYWKILFRAQCAFNIVTANICSASSTYNIDEFERAEKALQYLQSKHCPPKQF